MVDERVRCEEVTGETVDVAGGGHGVFETVLSSEGAEVGVADLNLDGEGACLVFEERGFDIGGHFAECGTEGGTMFRIAWERVLGADAFAFVADFDGARIYPEGAFLQLQGEGADGGLEGLIGVLQIADRFEAALFEGEGGDGTDSMDIPDGEGSEEVDFILFRDEGETVRLFVIASQFGEELVGGDADAGGEVTFLEDPLFERHRGGKGEAKGFIGRGCGGGEMAYIEISLVDGDLFDEG